MAFAVLRKLPTISQKTIVCVSLETSSLFAYTTIKSMEIRARILVTVLVVEARVRLHGCRARSGILEMLIVGLQQARDRKE